MSDLRMLRDLGFFSHVDGGISPRALFPTTGYIHCSIREVESWDPTCWRRLLADDPTAAHYHRIVCILYSV